MCASPTRCVPSPEPSPGTTDELDLAALDGVPPALRRRVLRAWLAEAGVTGLTDAQLRAADVLAVRGPDRAGVAVPGGLELVRAHGSSASVRSGGHRPGERFGGSTPAVYAGDIAATLVTAEAIRTKTAELAETIAKDYPKDRRTCCWSASSRARSCS